MRVGGLSLASAGLANRKKSLDSVLSSALTGLKQRQGELDKPRLQFRRVCKCILSSEIDIFCYKLHR